MAEASHLKQVLTEKLAHAEKDSTLEKKGLSGDETYLRDLMRNFQTRAQEFEVKTKGILPKKFGASFVELKATTRVQDDDVRVQAFRLIVQVLYEYEEASGSQR